MTYKLKGGEEWRDGKLYGWTGRVCPSCHGKGEVMDENDVGIGTKSCAACAGTGEEWGLMPEQPNE